MLSVLLMIDSFPGGRDGKVVVGCYGGGGEGGQGGEESACVHA